MRTEIVAECSCNHLGDMTIAKAMIDAAKWAGADTVKFQMYITNMINDPSLHGFLESARLTYDQHYELAEYCRKVEIKYLCSAFDKPSLKSVAKISDRIKIPSGQLHNKGYLEYARDLGLPLILSTGMSTVTDVAKALVILSVDDLIILHCNSAYPTPDKDTNLKVIEEMRSQLLTWKVGFSDHTTGNIAAIQAITFGAVMIEKHFMLSPFFKTPDTETSLTPKQFKCYVDDIRRAEIMLGTGEKMITESEKPNLHRRDYR